MQSPNDLMTLFCQIMGRIRCFIAVIVSSSALAVASPLFAEVGLHAAGKEGCCQVEEVWHQEGLHLTILSVSLVTEAADV